MELWRGLVNRCSLKQLFVTCLLCGIVFVATYHMKCGVPLMNRELVLESDVMDARYLPSVNCSSFHQEFQVDERKRFPTAIIIGVKKGGTRALLTMLELHPSVVTAHHEVHYFDYDENFQKGVESYIDQMPVSKPGQITIEKSPHYFVTDVVPQRMRMVSQNLKLILIVKDPVTRLISDFTQLDAKKVVNKREKRPSFEEAVLQRDGSVNTNYIPVQVSNYAVHLTKWLKYFPLSQILILDGDNFVANPYEELLKVQTFLQIKPFYTRSQFVFSDVKGFYCWKMNIQQEPKCLGDKKGRTHPTVSENVKQKLKQYYQSSNEQFYKLAQQKFNW